VFNFDQKVRRLLQSNVELATAIAISILKHDEQFVCDLHVPLEVKVDCEACLLGSDLCPVDCYPVETFLTLDHPIVANSVVLGKRYHFDGASLHRAVLLMLAVVSTRRGEIGSQE